MTYAFEQPGQKIKSNGLDIYYQAFGNPNDPAVVLIMGLDAQCIIWSMEFIKPIVAAGYYVIRFDNRDIGLSTWIQDWSRQQPYTLEDMAQDTVGLLDALGIEKAHIIGASMGGMIAQRLAISHSSRVLTLTSIMSSGYALNSRIVDKWGLKLLFRAAPFLLKNFNFRPKLLRMQPTVKSYLATYRRLAGRKYPFNADYFRALFSYAINERQGQNPRAIIQQFCAIAASGSRLSELQQIQAPTLVLHGTDDRLVPPTHAQLYAPLIPGVRVVWLDGVGHEMPHAVMPQVHEALFDLWK